MVPQVLPVDIFEEGRALDLLYIDSQIWVNLKDPVQQITCLVIYVSGQLHVTGYALGVNLVRGVQDGEGKLSTTKQINIQNLIVTYCYIISQMSIPKLQTSA